MKSLTIKNKPRPHDIQFIPDEENMEVTIEVGNTTVVLHREGVHQVRDFFNEFYKEIGGE